MPTELKTLRSLPLQAGHSVSAGSEKDCTLSSCSPHSVHAYWYVGTGPPRRYSGLGTRRTQGLALAVSECQCCVIGVYFVQSVAALRPSEGVIAARTRRSWGSEGTSSSSSPS